MNDQEWEKLIEENLRRAGKEISPRRELLMEIIKGTPVTTGEVLRYPDRGSGAIEFFRLNGWKVFASAAALVMVAAIGLAMQRTPAANPPDLARLPAAADQAAEIPSANPAVDAGTDDPPLLTQETPAANPAVNIINDTPLTADDVDETAVAIITDSSGEYSDLAGEADSSLLNDESEAINDFTKIYDDSEI